MLCQSCGSNTPDSGKFCQRCGASMDDLSAFSTVAVNTMPPPVIQSQINTSDDTAQSVRKEADQARSKVVMGRYKDAYFVSRSIVGIGTLVKVIGVIVGIVLFVIQSATASYLFRSDAAIVMSFTTSFIAGLVIYIVGVIVSAQGQMLKASLDSAVHSSPFLDDDQRVRVMSIT